MLHLELQLLFSFQYFEAGGGTRKEPPPPPPPPPPPLPFCDPISLPPCSLNTHPMNYDPFSFLSIYIIQTLSLFMKFVLILIPVRPMKKCKTYMTTSIDTTSVMMRLLLQLSYLWV